MGSDIFEPKEETPSGEVYAYSLKLPPFWAGDPIIWFAQVEAQFQTRQITVQATKYAYVVASLQADVALEVRDLLVRPPKTDQYDKLKAALIIRMGESEKRRLQKLLIAEELGDRKPAQLLRRMNQLLAGNTLEDSIFKQLFLQRLPTNVQLILATSAVTVTIEQLGATADKILEVTLIQPQLSSIDTPPDAVVSSQAEPSLSTLAMLVEDLTALLQQLSIEVKDLSRRS